MIKRISLFSVLLSLCASLSFAVTYKICIDPGHGGSDPGATGCSQVEKTNNVNLGNKFWNWQLRDCYDGAGGGYWNGIRTRTTDVYVSLQGRCDISNNNAVHRFMSNHNNACGCGATGTETFSYSSTGTGAGLRNRVQARMIAAWGLTNRGNKTANFYVLKYTNAPATLCEVGFIDKCSPDAARTGSASYQDSAGLAMLYAIQNDFGYTAYRPN